ncbi:MAG: M20/M25/M40 family metallo-hydrolase [Prevotellaceae bacterium]|jgi:acetylornithine deacetylase|nr:M20/M25/M40 family metallo-hydrolase [Prevotellaceae bacterium]
MIELLKKLIATPSFSGEEAGSAGLIYGFLHTRGIVAHRFLNNVWATNKYYSPGKPVLLLNSHHDTVKPSPAYSINPFEPKIENGKLYGLGSNDAGGSVVSLLSAFCDLYGKQLPYNLVIAVTAEEEAICRNGISALWPHLGKIDFALVGEPTRMQAAIAERGLIVLDCVAEGVPGHAARDGGKNALYEAIDDILWFKNYRFPKVSKLAGEVKMTVTVIHSGTQHNVIPSKCEFVADIRSTDCYSNEEIVEIIKSHVKSRVTPRSLHLKASAISEDHILVKTVKSMGIPCYISPTTSDISRIDVPAIKIGPGDSVRSHTADEFIHIEEIETAVKTYGEILEKLADMMSIEEITKEKVLL